MSVTIQTGNSVTVRSGNRVTISAPGPQGPPGSGGGTGDVVGPSTATDNAIARFNLATGKLIQSSGITIADGATGTLSGTNTGDQTITLTGDVTGSGTGTFAATIANDAVTFAKMQEISGTHLVGRHAGGTGNIQEVSVGNGVEFQGSGIRRSALTGDVTAPAGSNTTTLANTAVTPGAYTRANVTVDSKGRITAAENGAAIDLATEVTGTLDDAYITSADTWNAKLNPDGNGSALTGITAAQVGAIAETDTLTQFLNFPNAGIRILDATGDHVLQLGFVEELTASRALFIAVNDANRTINLSGNLTVSAAATISGTNTGNQTISLTGDVTGSGTGSFAATIANDAVTYAKMQNVSAASRLLGRGDSGSGDPQEITLGSGLSMSGTTLNVTSGGTGTVTSVAVSGTDGIEVDSGSPITSAGTIQLGVNSATMKTTLDLAGTNTGDVTLAGTPDYITISGQTITRNAIDLATDVTGTLPIANGGTGITALGTGVATALGQNVTGSGSIVLGTSPTLTTPALGTPSAVVLTNATGTASGLTTGEATAALGLKTATTTVSVSGATAPTSGQVLTATSSTAATWQTPSGGGSGDMVLLASATASASSEILFDNVFNSSLYCEYVLKFQGVQPATDNVAVRFQLRNSTPASITDTHRNNQVFGRIDATQAVGNGANLGGTTGWTPLADAGNAANEYLSGTINIQPIAGQWTHMNYQVYATNAAGGRFMLIGAGACEGTTAPAGVRIYMSSGNIASGTFQLYGIAK